jgi:hypothetical protein
VDLIMAVADPDADDVRALLGQHLAFAREVTPPEHVYALDTDAWADPDLTLYEARRNGLLVDAFAAARSMYLKAGFRPCPPFGEYTASPYSVCLTLPLRRARR